LADSDICPPWDLMQTNVWQTPTATASKLL
jgi:hypothetical protein